jgi:Fe2+ transport system protein FeoA
MDGVVTLDQLGNGSEARIASIAGEGPFRRRLLELGLVPGTPIARIGQAPLGDPLTFRVRRAVVCLRRAEAALVGLQQP